jgi:hypothetical protein
MNVIRHKTVGVQETTRARQYLAQVEKIKAAILIAEEAVAPIVASLDQMHCHIGKHDAGASGHAGVNGLARRTLTGKNVVCP